MGRPKQFHIAFDNNPSAVYYGGQTVQGTVTLELEEPLSMRAIRVEYKGKATVHWTETRSTGKTTYTVVYHSDQHYFNGKQDLWTKAKDGGGSDELPRGLYRYPFQFTLPPDIPCSFEGRDGHVRYVVKGVIDRRFRFNQDTKKAFTVINDLNLNEQKDASLPMNHSKHKFLCCLCCKSGPITGSLHIPRKGYVPGEAIMVDAEIENLSRRKMAKPTVRILQLTDFHATTKTRRQTVKVAELKHGEIPPGGGDQWRAERLLVPPVPPSFLQGCRIIDIKYLLQLNVDPTGLGFDLTVPLEIVIGTVPLTQVMDNYSSLQVPQPSAPTRDQIYSAATGPYPDTSTSLAPARPPPPTYNQSVFGNVNITEDDDDKENAENNNYTPMYTYYNWGFSSSSSAV